MKKRYNCIDLFSGVGGLTLGMHKAGFKTIVAVENDSNAVIGFKMNHKKTYVIQKDVRQVKISEIKKRLSGRPLHLLAGCPPCQGFSSVRRLNGTNVQDQRNNLVMEYLRFVRALKPLTIMLENVPGLKNYYLFKQMMKALVEMGYDLNVEIVNVRDYGVPQNRKRLVMVGSLLGGIEIAKSKIEERTVRQTIGNLESVKKTKDPSHKIHSFHRKDILDMIKLIPKNGGSRRDLPEKYTLECHKKENIGFADIYGRLRWDDFSTTITGGCLNASKGRFLHPTQNRTISAREAALLQSFPRYYKFPTQINKDSLALLIGNALPPKFSYIQSRNIKRHLDYHLDKVT